MALIRKKDRVVVLWGKEAGKEGEVLKVFPQKQQVLIGKVNLVKRHTRSRPTQPGGIVEKEAPLPWAKVSLVCPRCKRSSRARLGSLSDGTRVRVCRLCGETIG